MQPDQIVSRIRSLPTLSAVVSRLSTLLADGRSTAADFESVIRLDPALTADVLRVTNSAYFGLSRRVESVRQAVTLLGLKRVYELTAGVSLSRVIPRMLPGYGMEASAFWLHCIAVAVLGERLAAELGLRPPQLTFTAGILHDVGKLVIEAFVAAEAATIGHLVRAERQPLVLAERTVLGVDHAEVGAAVCEAWDLPPAVAWGARWHHAPDKAPPETDRTLVDLVHAADALAHMLGLGADVGELARAVEPGALARLNVKPRQLEHVASLALENIRELGASLALTGANR